MLQTFLHKFYHSLLALFLLSLAGRANADNKPSPGKEAQETLQERVQAIVDEQCAFAGCHVGANAPQNLDMSEEMLIANLVGVKSADGMGLRVKPGDPANSYLIRKLRGGPNIKGDRMPRGSKPMTNPEIAVFEAWIKSLPRNMKAQEPKMEYARAFPGWSLANLQTAETIDKGAFVYRIAHKFRGSVKLGFDQLYGLDVGADMMGHFVFPFSNDYAFSVARSRMNATFEFGVKGRLLREKTDRSMPISAAIYAGVDWATLGGLLDPADSSSNPQSLSRTDGERFAYFGQLALSKQLGKHISLLAVPGILLNGNVALTNEDLLVTLGIAGKFSFNEKYGLFAEIIPILSGDATAATVGGPNTVNGKQVIYDTFNAGLEIKAGGHVFHIYVSNSAGNTTNQYMSGGNFDATNGDLRLGFNIYRILNYPF